MTVFLGCRTYSYFNTSNDLQNINCTLGLVDGRQLHGSLTVQLETGRLAGSLVQLKTNDVIQKVAIDSIAFYSYGPDYYYPKEIDLNAYTIPNRFNLYLPNQRNLLFLKRLTKENSKLNLYELFQSRTQAEDGADHYYYFVSLPSENSLKAWSLGSNVFFPKFDEKMSQVVSECPTLFNKIRQKKNGYALSQLSLDLKKLEVFKRIIDEYNQCN